MIALVFANLARFPQDDGPYAYFRRALSLNEGKGSTAARRQGFGGIDELLFALWCYWVSIWITNATVAIGVVGYLSSFLPALNQSKLVCTRPPLWA